MKARMLNTASVALICLSLLATLSPSAARAPTARTAPPEPTPSPTVDIRTKLQPYQVSDREPSQPDGRVLEEARLLTPETEENVAEVLGQRTFYSIADATVLQGYSSQNFGDTVDMWAGYDEYLSPHGRICRSLVKFDISSLPPGQEITEATLRLYLVGSWDFPDTSRTIRTYRATSRWSETSVTWNNKPGYGGSYGSSSIVHGAWGWYEFDVTDLVSAWYNGTYTNHGIMVLGPEVSGYDSSWRSFGTRESDYTPQLVVDYSSSTPPDIGVTPTSFEITLQAGESAQRTMTIANAGEETLTYSISDVETTASMSKRVESPRSYEEKPSEIISDLIFSQPVVKTEQSTVDSELAEVELEQQKDLLRYKKDASVKAIGDVILSFPAPGSDSVGLAWDGEYLWDADDSAETPKIYKLDPSDGSVLSSFPSPGDGPRDLAWDGGYLWNVDFLDDLIYRIDPSDGSIMTSIPAPTGISSGLAWDGTFLWVSEWYSNKIYKVDPTNGSVITSFSGPEPGEYPKGLAWDGSFLWCSYSGSGTIYKLDPSDGSVITSFSAPSIGAYGLAWDGQYLWNNNWVTNIIYKIDIGHVSDCPWLDENPKSGSVPSGAHDEITVSIDTTGLDPGEYTADIVVANNDPDENPVTVPVALLVKEDTTLPDIDVSPTALEETLAEGKTVVRTLTINNTGSAVLTFDIHEVNGGFTPAATRGKSIASDHTSQFGSGAVANALSWIGVVPEPPPEFESAPMREATTETPPSRTGLLQPPMDLSHLTGDKLPGDGVPAVLPDEFDWRDRSGTNYVTPVKDQANCGACYTFGPIGNLESKLLIDGAGTYDLSENNAKECNWRELNNFQYPNPGDYWGSCDGGNAFMMANLFSQKGTVLESCDPYQDSDVGCKSTCPYQKTVLGWRLISGGVPDPAVPKQYIYDHGPVITSMYADSAEGFNSYDGSYTIDYTTPGDATNHCVLIVGWSDNLPPVSGSGTAADGWIVKNSWGTSWGDRGYFYITYGAANIGSASSFFNAWQDYDTSGDIWYYDEGGWWSSFGETGGSNTTAWGLAKFTASDDTTVTRVEFWTADETTDVDVYVYDNFDGTTLSGLRASELNSTFGEAGYHSVALDSPVAVSEGDDVIAVVKFTDANFGYPVVVDQIGPIETGRTYISLTGGDGSWTDLGAALDSDAGIRLRTSEPSGEDVLWLSEEPTSGTVPAAGSQAVDVTFDATGLSLGTYTADIVIDNNDPDEDPVTVPVTLHVSSSSTPPTISGLPDQQVPVNGSEDNAIDLWAYAHDAEDADADLTFTISNSPAAGAGVTIDSNRYVDINPVTGWTGTTEVEIQVEDSGGLTDTDSFQVTITNSPPTISGLPDQELLMNSSVDNAIDLWAYADDAEDADADLTFTISNAPASSAGVSIDSNRYIDINPTTDWTGETEVEIEVEDTGGLTDSDTFRVTVNAHKVYLPAIVKQCIPLPGAPVDGRWSGTTSAGQSVSFDVSGCGTSVRNFRLVASGACVVPGGICSYSVFAYIPPTDIANNQFSHDSGEYSISAEFTSATTASGTYAFDNYEVTCFVGTHAYTCYLNQSGTWAVQPAPTESVNMYNDQQTARTGAR